MCSLAFHRRLVARAKTLRVRSALPLVLVFRRAMSVISYSYKAVHKAHVAMALRQDPGSSSTWTMSLSWLSSTSTIAYIVNTWSDETVLIPTGPQPRQLSSLSSFFPHSTFVHSFTFISNFLSFILPVIYSCFFPYHSFLSFLTHAHSNQQQTFSLSLQINTTRLHNRDHERKVPNRSPQHGCLQRPHRLLRGG